MEREVVLSDLVCVPGSQIWCTGKDNESQARKHITGERATNFACIPDQQSILAQIWYSELGPAYGCLETKEVGGRYLSRLLKFGTEFNRDTCIDRKHGMAMQYGSMFVVNETEIKREGRMSFLACQAKACVYPPCLIDGTLGNGTEFGGCRPA